MKFSQLAEILVKANLVTDVQIAEDCEVDDLNLMDQNYQQFGECTIYFIDSGDVGPGTVIPMCLIYKHVFPEFRSGSLRNSAKIPESVSMAEVFRYVKLQLTTTPEVQSEYARLVSKLVSGVSLKTILSDAFSITGNQFVAIDLSGKILEHSMPFYVDYPLWMKSVEQGYCDEILMDYIQSRRRMLHNSARAQLIDLYCKKIDMYILVARIIHNNTTLGYFFALNRKPAFDAYTQKLLPLFAQRVKENILRLKNMDKVDNYRFIMQTNILLDAVNGASPTEMLLRTKLSGLKFYKNMRVIKICSRYSKDPDFYSQILMPQVEEIFRNQPCFPYKSSIICLVSTKNNGDFVGEKLEELILFSKNNSLKIGISNNFSDISLFLDHFEQADTALSFSTRVYSEEVLYYFLDYALYIIFDKVGDEKLLSYACHPLLDWLLVYDKRKGTDLFQTLQAYTEAGFNKVRAAQTLFIHRNTINYRIQQIGQMYGIDLSSEKTLFLLQIAFRLYAYRKNLLTAGKQN